MVNYELHLGDCLEVMRGMGDDSVDAVVTDPPYGFGDGKRAGFMGKKWDYDVPSVEIWKEALRVLKPGGHLLAFAGTRTQHRMCCRIEDAGFEIKNMFGWIFGSGFPKNKDALKPAFEPITLARKPISENTVAANVLEHGTGGLNIDGCRVGTDDNLNGGAYANNPTQRDKLWGEDAGNAWVRGGAGKFEQPSGRWPANIIHDGSPEVLEVFPNENGKSAARFFYCAKASKADRDEGLEGFESKACGMMEDDNYPIKTGSGNLRDTQRRNHHATVKPHDLMRYLCRLITPPSGIVLDPFMGSGSTGKACMAEGFNFIGIELNPEYLEIARARINHALSQPVQPDLLDMEAAL